MKHILRYLPLLIIAFAAASCNKDFLEKPIGADVNEDTIFSRRVNAETFLWDTYRRILPSGFPYHSWGWGGKEPYISSVSQTCDEATSTVGWSWAYGIAVNGNTPTDGTGDLFTSKWDGIRKAYIFLSDIDKVSDIPQAEKDQMKGEVKAMLALTYSEMLKRWGGVPLVKARLYATDNTQIPRSTLKETVDFIVKLCDEAAAVLPDNYDSKWRGRMTKGAALATKGRTLLFAASPLFNTDAPYINSANRDLYSYPSYDATRWQTAADANKAVIDWAAQSGWCKIINTGNPFDDYGRATSDYDNAEMILAYKGKITTWDKDGFQWWYEPFDWQGGCKMTLQALKFFYKQDGTEQSWPAVDEHRLYSDYSTRMDAMEARCRQIVYPVGKNPYNNPTKYPWSITGWDGNDGGVCRVTKFLYNYQGEHYKDWPIFRLGEFYLNYAEALNEAQPNAQGAYDALNVIRSRAGLPQILITDPNYNTQDKLRQAIRRERAIELYGEEHRAFDVRRWLIAETPGVIGSPFYTFQFSKTADKKTLVDYYTMESPKRAWYKKLYLYPFPQSEVNKGYLIQNPGY
ncbi:MAG: RagB/SusD family nutrient uptake outer membrane protein [Bacteroidota bacterium]|nr:RagB/SusD family nutrient uptake outer membrane protein [Bacteroidota bacterium]